MKTQTHTNKYQYVFVAQRHYVEAHVYGYANNIENINHWVEIGQSKRKDKAEKMLSNYSNEKTRVVVRRIKNCFIPI